MRRSRPRACLDVADSLRMMLEPISPAERAFMGVTTPEKPKGGEPFSYDFSYNRDGF